MRLALKEVWANPYIRVLVSILGFFLLYFLLMQTRVAWVSFLLAYLLAYLANPLVALLESRRLPRWAGVVVVFILLVMVVFLGYLLMTEVIRQLGEFFERLPELLAPLIAWLQDRPALLARFMPADLGEADIFQQLTEDLLARLQGFGEWLLAGITGIVTGVFQVFVILVLAFYLLFNYPVINKSMLRAFPPSYRPLASDLGSKLEQAVGSFIRAEVVIALFVGFMIWFGLSLLGVPLALPLGVIAGLFNLVPYLGPIVAYLPAVLLALTLGLPYALGVTAIFIAVNQIDGNFLSPIVLAKATALHPVTVIIAILSGASLLGLVGALIAVPLAAFLKIIYQDYYLASAWYKRRNL